MNAAIEVDRLLSEHGAVLIRHAKHQVYRLPNNQKFTRSRTPGDHRAPLNELSDLRRALGIQRQAQPTQGETTMPMPQRGTAPVKAPSPAPETHQQSLKERLQTAITVEEQNQERVLAEAQAVERRVNMLKALLPFADDPSMEVSLRGVLPAPEPPPAPKPSAPPPPDAITERVQVTRQLVFAATQTFPETFTVNDVMDLMTGGNDIEKKERLRVRQSIAQAIVTLHERGEIVKEEEHYGRRQTIWRKALLNGNGAGVGTRA